MKTAIIVIFAACVIGTSLAEDCSTKIKAFHKCLEDSQKKGKDERKIKFEALKVAFDACYTANGCTAPSRNSEDDASGKDDGSADSSEEQHGNKTKGSQECRSAFRRAKKEKFEECIKKAIPNFTVPPNDEEHDGQKWGGNHKGENKHLSSCTKKHAVRECKRALFNSSRPSENEKRAQFKAKCDAKDKCLVALGADCQAQLEKIKKAACDCREQLKSQNDQIRAGVAACKGVEDRKGTRPPRKQQSWCEHKDYCKLGYDAFVQDRPQGKDGPRRN